MHQFCIRTAVGSAIIGVIVRTTESQVEVMTVHICSGNDPNLGKSMRKYQEEKYDAALDSVFLSSKNVVKTASILRKKLINSMKTWLLF